MEGLPIFELLVKQHPAFDEFRVERGWWGWARKAAERPSLKRRLQALRPS